MRDCASVTETEVQPPPLVESLPLLLFLNQRGGTNWRLQHNLLLNAESSVMRTLVVRVVRVFALLYVRVQ